MRGQRRKSISFASLSPALLLSPPTGSGLHFSSLLAFSIVIEIYFEISVKLLHSLSFTLLARSNCVFGTTSWVLVWRPCGMCAKLLTKRYRLFVCLCVCECECVKQKKSVSSLTFCFLSLLSPSPSSPSLSRSSRGRALDPICRSQPRMIERGRERGMRR